MYMHLQSYIDILIMKNYLWLLAITSLLIKVNSICQAFCKACSDKNVCTQCLTGFFLTPHGQCLLCPWLTTLCKINQIGIPISTECEGDRSQPIIDQNTNLCTFCSSACLTCDKTATNCTSCYEGFYLSNSQCVKNSTCSSIAYCNNCEPEGSGSTLLICTDCFSGYFEFGRGCVQCNDTCSECEVSQQGLWNTEGLPWFNKTIPLVIQKVNQNTKKRRLLQSNTSAFTDTFTKWTTAEWNAANWTSTVWQQYSKMDPKMVRKALYVYNFFRAVCQQMAVNRTQIDIVYQSLFLFEDLLKIPQQDNQTQWKYLSKFVTQITNIKWNHFELKNSVREEAKGSISCTGCARKYFVDTYNIFPYSFCNSCPESCDRCTTFQICTACNNGYYLSTNKTCESCHSGCADCQFTPTNCTGCPSGIFLNIFNFTCPVCKNPCLLCNPSSPSTCTQCVAGYSRLPDQSGKCYRCKDQNCTHCSSTNTSVCLACKPGYFRTSNSCYLCPQNCYLCLYVDAKNGPVCYISQDKYALSNSQYVQACTPGCTLCLDYAANTCSYCQDLYYYIDHSTQKCISCPKYCYRCNKFGDCLLPEFGYIFFDVELAKCRVGCQTCDSQDPQKCTQCGNGYYLDKGHCYPCLVGCVSCNKKDVCDQCQPRYQLVNGVCLSCQGDCQQCDATNLSVCTSCRYNYIFYDGKCLTNLNCPEGCDSCDKSNLIRCNKCSIGYTITQEGKCVKCMDRCQGSCLPSHIGRCTSCFAGYMLLPNECRKCPDHAIACTLGNTLLCEDGYFFQNGACVKFCDAPCLTCFNDTGKCQTCQPNFNLTSDGQCIFDDSCNPFCDYCASGYWSNPSTGNCDKCPQNCEVCVQKTCIICKQNYYVNDSTPDNICVACISPCKTCDDSVTCLSCIDGYLLQVYDLYSYFGSVFGAVNLRCAKCDSDCLTCKLLPSICTSCSSPKILKDTKCLGVFTVKFEYNFNLDYSDFLNNNRLSQFLNILSQQTGVNKSKIKVEYIRQGSTIVGGTIAADSQSQATTIQNKISSPNSMSKFASTKTDASTIVDNQTNNNNQVNNNHQDDTDNGKLSGGAIAGIIVGSVLGGLLIVGVLIFVCWTISKKKKQQTISSNAESDQYNATPISTSSIVKPNNSDHNF